MSNHVPADLVRALGADLAWRQLLPSGRRAPRPHRAARRKWDEINPLRPHHRLPGHADLLLHRAAGAAGAADVLYEINPRSVRSPGRGLRKAGEILAWRSATSTWSGPGALATAARPLPGGRLS